ncbi:hypothetical protein DKX38_003246 [Salix brachista]|uniref:Uncharacterized protein n=1 Tax=Salix brachista TaxID=2182728 RepID=A0A5N5NRP9_9ROSI|nr:hypothetical protein DKX38_003246 [Salix brachista]
MLSINLNSLVCFPLQMKKLDDSEFRNAFSRAYVRVREYDSKRDSSRSPIRDRSHSRGRSDSRSRSLSRSRSRRFVCIVKYQFGDQLVCIYFSTLPLLCSKSPKNKSLHRSPARSRPRSVSRSPSGSRQRSQSRY